MAHNPELQGWDTREEAEAAMAEALRTHGDDHTPWLCRITPEGWFAPNDAPELETLAWGVTDEETGMWVLDIGDDGLDWFEV